MNTPTADVFSPFRLTDQALLLLDQTLLPAAEIWLECTSADMVAEAIRRLAVRGAPAIGVSAAYGLVLAARAARDQDPPSARAVIAAASATLAATRPTAVNLRWALDCAARMLANLPAETSAESLSVSLERFAEKLHADDVAANLRLSSFGAPLLHAARPGLPPRILTHCNTGALATAGWGTALGVIASAAALSPIDLVWVDETRPLLQGARLTAWECAQRHLPHRLITDNMAASLMARGLVDVIIVGADRIAANGDTANKIGTYGLAVLARHHNLPFYVAAPVSTLDPTTPNGAAIPIEERAASEVSTLAGIQTAPLGTPVANPAFDVTPANLITAIITEAGVLTPPYDAAIAAAANQAT